MSIKINKNKWKLSRYKQNVDSLSFLKDNFYLQNNMNYVCSKTFKDN